MLMARAFILINCSSNNNVNYLFICLFSSTKNY